jgi:hypothetical protein
MKPIHISNFFYLLLFIVVGCLHGSCSTPSTDGPGKSLSLNPDYKYEIKQIIVINDGCQNFRYIVASSSPQ